MSKSGVGATLRPAYHADDDDYQKHCEAVAWRCTELAFKKDVNKFIVEDLHEVYKGTALEHYHWELPRRIMLAGCPVGTRSPNVLHIFQLAKQAVIIQQDLKIQLNHHHKLVVQLPTKAQHVSAMAWASHTLRWGRLVLKVLLACTSDKALNTFINNKALMRCLSLGGQGSDKLLQEQPQLAQLLQLQHNKGAAYQLYWRLLCLAAWTVACCPEQQQLHRRLQELETVAGSVPRDQQWVLLGLDLLGMDALISMVQVQVPVVRPASQLTAKLQAQKVAAASAAPAAAAAASPRVVPQLTTRVSAPIPLSLMAEVPQLASISGPGSLASPVAIEPPAQCPRPCRGPVDATAATAAAVVTIPTATAIISASGSTTAKAASKKRSNMSLLMRLLTWGCGVRR